MSRDPQFASPIVKTYPEGGAASVVLRDRSSTTKLLIRAGPETAAADQLRIAFGASRIEREVLIVGQRPDEFLLLGDHPTVAAYSQGLDRGGPVSVIDYTHSRALFQLSGPAAAKHLQFVCSIDWSDAMMPNGAVVSAPVAKVGCDIIRQDARSEPAYLILCDRSFGQYLFDALLDAASVGSTGFGMSVR